LNAPNPPDCQFAIADRRCRRRDAAGHRGGLSPGHRPLAWLYVLRDARGRRLMLDAGVMGAPLLVYAVLRSQTPALTHATG
jgi:hypothetical protein